jgi:transposase
MGSVYKIGKPSAAWLLSGRLARSAADAANSMFTTRLVRLAKEAGREAGEVNESHTSQTCRKCGAVKKMPLALRIYECEGKGCGHMEDRDVNAACQIALREFDEKKKPNAPKGLKNGVLPRRGIPQGVTGPPNAAQSLLAEFQAKPPCKRQASVGRGAELG